MGAAVAAAEDVVGVAVAVAANAVLQSLPKLGVGLGYRPQHQAELFGHRDRIAFLEIVADHYYEPSPIKSAELDMLHRNLPLIPHGLALSLGSAEGLDAGYVKRFQQVVQRVRPPWCSDHIAFTRAGGIDIGHLTPLPKTKASLRVLHDNIRSFQDIVATPLILENITESIRFPEDEFDDAEFLGRVCDQNDIGLLLDVTNLYINSVNHGFDATSVLHRLPADRIVQLHFAGGHIQDGLWIDSHAAPTQPEIWDLLIEVVKFADVKGIILERDEHIPPLAELMNELERAASILKEFGR